MNGSKHKLDCPWAQALGHPGKRVLVRPIGKKENGYIEEHESVIYEWLSPRPNTCSYGQYQQHGSLSETDSASLQSKIVESEQVANGGILTGLGAVSKTQKKKTADAAFLRAFLPFQKTPPKTLI
jgi:hypothetical protein